MGDGVGPLNEALESVTTERVGVLSHTPTDPSQFLNVAFHRMKSYMQKTFSPRDPLSYACMLPIVGAVQV